MSAETDIAAYLAGKGRGTVNSSIFVNYRPATPANLISVTGYGGSAPDWTHDTSGNANPRVQVWVRNTSNSSARTLIEACFDDLDGLTNQTLSGTFYPGIFAIQHPQLLAQDENNRWEYVCNFDVKRRR
jgi:hypothetical protein